MKAKVNRSQFLQSVSKATGYSVCDLKMICKVMEGEAVKVLSEGNELSITGFGVFSLKQHKGHPVQFEAAGKHVSDYTVLKFTPSGVFMSKIRKEPVTVESSATATE